MGRAVPILIGFLASLLGIGGLADKVLGVIRKIRQRIENAIVKFWNFVKGKAAKLISKIGVSKKDKKDISDKAIDLTTVRITVPTKTDGNHNLYLRKDKKGFSLIMESTPTFYSDFINQIETTEENKYDKNKALIISKRLDILIDSAVDEKDKQEITEKLKELSNLQ